MRKNIIKKPQGNPDLYKDKNLDKEDFMKIVKQNLRKLSAAGDPKGLRQMQKLSDQQLKTLKDEQLRQVYDEREVLKTQAEEIKRLEWLNKKLNHSYGLKNRHETPNNKRKRSKSAAGRAFVHQGPYQDWTNTFKRSTLHWDERNGLLEQEKPQVKSLKVLVKYPMRCCGNSPGKQHSNTCDMDKPGQKSTFASTSANTTSAKKGTSQGKNGRIIKSA